jgi:drug/metabolite transporter (DMT)-like permease
LGNESSSAAISVFILATGCLLAIASLFFPEAGHWSWKVVAELLFLAIVPTYLGYVFWDMAMTKGDLILVTSLVYFNPLTVMVFSALFLGIVLTWNLWIACALVIAGSVICEFSFRESAPGTGK